MMRWIGAVLVLLAVAAWWVVGGPGAVDTADPSQSAVLPGAAAVALPSPQSRLPDAAVPSREPEPLVPRDPAPAGVPEPGTRAARLLASGEPLSVSGRVVDATGAPLSGADVWFLPMGRLLASADYPTTTEIPFIGLGTPAPALVTGVPLEDLPHTLTDAAGAFTLTGPDRHDEWNSDPFPAPQTAQLIVRSQDCAVRVSPISLAGGELSPRDILLRRAGATAGRVVDETGRPLASVEVRLIGIQSRPEDEQALWYWAQTLIGGLQTTSTQADGSFQLGGLWPGAATLEFVLPGRATATREDVAITADVVTPLGDVVLEQGGAIEGRVVDTAGRAVAGAVVFATAHEVTMSGRGCVINSLGPEDDSLPLELEAEWWRGTCAATSNADGRFRISGLLVPTVTLYARADGFEAARARDVSAGAREALLVLQPEACLDVRVLAGDTGRPVPTAAVKGRRVIGTGHDSVGLRGDQRGDGVRVFGVGRLGTEVFVEAPGYARTRVEQPGQAPGSLAELTVTLVPETFIGGRITSTAGQPVAGARVSLTRAGKPGMAPWITGTSAADGTYAFPGLTAGEWKLQVVAEGFARSEERAVACGADERVPDADFVLAAGAVVEGRVHRLALVDGPRYRVTVNPTGPSDGDAGAVDGAAALEALAFAWSETDGSFRVGDLPAGEHVVSVEKVGLQRVTLAPGERTTVNFDARLPQVDVRITSGSAPCAGVMLEVREAGRRYSSGAAAGPSDEEGRITVLLPAAGDYELLALSPGTGARRCGPVGESGPLGVAWGERRHVDLALGGGRIAGVVVAPDGPFAGEALWVTRDGDGFGLVSTDAEGRFALEHLLPGTYVIRSNGACDHREHLAVNSGAIALGEHAVRENLTLSLDWGAAISGTVRSDGGALAPESAVVCVARDGASSLTSRGSVSQGRYEVEGLEPGDYQVCAHRVDSWSSEHECAAGLPVTLVSGKPLELDLRLQP